MDKKTRKYIRKHPEEYRELLRLTHRTRRMLDEWAVLALLDPTFAEKKAEIYALMQRVLQIEQAAKEVWAEANKEGPP